MLSESVLASEAEFELLGAGEDGDGDFVDVGGGEEENDVGGGFFEGLEEGVEGGFREHVDFVDDVDFVGAGGGGELGALEEVADVVDAGVGGGVDFDDVDIVVFELVGEAVDFVGYDAGDGGFADAAGAGEEVGVGKLAGFDRGGEGDGDVVLADDAVKRQAPVLPI